jgi:phosphohistidine phosphatase
MDLLIVRHAIAFERDPHRWRGDVARPLSPRGMKRARNAAAGLKTFCEPPDRLFTSPLLRTVQTARILTEVAGWPRAEEAAELAPGGSPLEVLSLLGKNRLKRVAVVGHQPELGALLTICLTGDERPLSIDIKKNAVVCLFFGGSPRPGRATLQWLATPRMLRGLRHD